MPSSSEYLDHHYFQAAHWISAATFFADAPWLRVPLWRQGAMHEVPCRARGGLLGGSPASGSSRGKVSKLQALARQRRDTSRSSLSDETPEKTEPQQDDRMRMLQKLSQRKRASQTSSEKGESSNSGARDIGSSSRPEAVTLTEASGLKITNTSARGGLKATPSVFAKTILGRAPGSSASDQGPALKRMPLTTYSPAGAITERSIFLEPSPDDVVTAAQSSKGEDSRSPGDRPSLTGSNRETRQKRGGIVGCTHREWSQSHQHRSAAATQKEEHRRGS